MKNVYKTLERSNDHYIQFTEEEMEYMNIKPGDKFSCKINSDGSVLFDKFVPIELDIESWDKETLLFLIEESIEKDISVNDVINTTLEQCLKENEPLVDYPGED